MAAARAGGGVLIEGLTRPAEIELKSERTSIVTWADVTAQAAIVDLLAEEFPGHAVLGEEGLAGDPDGPCTWLVDPLDGTSNYAHGIPLPARPWRFVTRTDWRPERSSSRSAVSCSRPCGVAAHTSGVSV